MGIVVISHNLDIFFRLCDRSYFLADGELTLLATAGQFVESLPALAKQFVRLCGLTSD